MAFVCQLIEGTEPAINLFYSADDDWSLIEKGFEPNDPERRELWGGYLENVLVRQEDGKRPLPLKLMGEFTTVDGLIDAVNALEERLRHAARYRIDGWGDEVFLRLQLHNSTYGVDYPVSSGSINKADLMNACNMPMDGTGHREVKRLVNVGVTIVCGEPYWEAQEIYTLENLCDNPGWWRGVTPGDSWNRVNAPDLTDSISTNQYEVMGKSLDMVCANDPVNDTGVWSDNITVVASTAYYFEVRGRHLGVNQFTARVYNVTGGAIIAGTSLIFDNADLAWEKQGVAFTTPVGCVSVRIELLRLAADSSVAGGECYFDAVYLTPGTDAPVGWSSGRNLVNCLTPTADQINVLCVTEIPGEVAAEIKTIVELANDTRYLRVAKRTRDAPHNFIWELNADTAYTTADAHYALTDASCIDSLKENDATCPVGHRITVTFAGDPTMQQRCYWDIAADLASYYGPFVVFVVARVTGATDIINMEIKFADDPLWSEIGGTIKQRIAATSWTLHDGWEVFSFRVGTHDNGLFGVGNNCRLMLRAETNGTTDDLYIAGAYWCPIHEALLVAGSDGGTFAGGTSQMIIKDMDGDRGVFGYGTVSDTYYANLGSVGVYPLLEPEVENWWYFVTTGNDDGWVFNDAYSVAVQYRPRGIFLRGSNPG